MTRHACRMVLAFSAMPAAALGADAEFEQGMRLYRELQYDRAVSVLSAWTDKGAETEAAGQALYTIASIQSARGRTEAADKTLQRLLAKHAASTWAVNACAVLAGRAASSKAWDQASQLTAQFLDLYLTRPYAAVDDSICRQTFARLVDYEKRRASGASSKALHRQLKKRYPPSSPSGRVVALFVSADPNEPGANLVLNPGFELDGREIGTVVGWRYLGTEPNVHDDADGTLVTGAQGGLIRAHDGKYCAGKFTTWGKHRGWLYQRVGVLAGRGYEVSAYGMTPAAKGQPGQLRVGVDLEGGMDPVGSQVRWTEAVSALEDYKKLGFEGASAVTSKGPFLTVFLEIRQEKPVDPNAMVFDDVAVRQVE